MYRIEGVKIGISAGIGEKLQVALVIECQGVGMIEMNILDEIGGKDPLANSAVG